MRTISWSAIPRWVFSIIVVTTLLVPATVLSQHTPAPDRVGPDDNLCPPGPSGGKAPATHARDKDVNGDRRNDYFMGEWKFIEGNKDVLIRQWCINKPRGPRRVFNDFFTYEIQTSLRNNTGGFDETPRVNPGVPT